MKNRIASRAPGVTLLFVIPVLLIGSPARATEIQLINDPLNGSTVGVQQGGSFVTGGWQAAAGPVRIDYDLAQAYGAGRFEVDVTSYDPCHQPNAEKVHIMAMWQGAKARQPSITAEEAHWIFRTGTGYQPPLNQSGCTMPLADCCEYKLITKPTGPLATAPDHESRVDTANAWSLSATYHYALSWYASGRVVLLRDGITLYDHTHASPLYLRYLQIGRDSETKPNYGEQPGVIYANVQVFVDDAELLCADPCDDLDPCTVNDVCQSASSCGGTPILCETPPSDCHEPTGACQGGACDYDVLPDGTLCAGGVCQAGTCVATNDGGVPADGGADPDGGAGLDGGSLVDGQAADANASADDGSTTDTDASDGHSPGATGGCNCRSAKARPGFSWWLLIFILILLRIRRR